ncbi:MAG: chemotaxis protein CheD [Pseudomonadota bacterium]
MKYTTVLQGESKVTNDPEVVFTTVLGSCVAVCLHDAQAKVGGMNHFLLPGCKGQDSKDMRYGVHSMELLINELLKHGASRHSLLAQLYGGASVIKNRSNIGASNVNFATDFLRNESIKCLDRNVGGKLARRVKFHAATGRVKHVLVEDAVSLRPPAPDPRVPTRFADVTLF